MSQKDRYFNFSKICSDLLDLKIEAKCLLAIIESNKALRGNLRTMSKLLEKGVRQHVFVLFSIVKVYYCL